MSCVSHASLVGKLYNSPSYLGSYLEPASLNHLTAFYPEKHYAYRAGPNTTYTNDFVPLENVAEMEMVHNDAPVFGDKPVLVLTNGNCFSSCAIFTHVLKSHFGLEVVTVGGIRNESIAISASCLGFTTPSINDEILKPDQAEIMTTRSTPFQVKVDLAYAASAMYVNSHVPCEFVYLEPDNRIFYTNENIESMERLWLDASQHFPNQGMPLKIDYRTP